MLIRCSIAMLACLALPTGAQVVRFQDVLRGNMTMAGNSLGLSKQAGANGPGTLGSIGTFISTDASLADSLPLNMTNPWPGGTTPAWQFNGSTGSLSLPPTAVVAYAELLWGGSYAYVEDVSAFLNDSVTFAGPLGGSLSVSPDPATAVTRTGFDAEGLFPVNYYLRSAEVTSFVLAEGAGMYATLGVPATQNEAINSLNAAGWALVVVYADYSEPSRYLALVTDGRFVEENNDADLVFGGLSTPGSGTVSGKLLVVALEGDASSSGDTLRIRPDADPFVTLSGPNNPANNFFASQVNDLTGMIDTSGSFGLLNHSAFSGANLSGGRQGWDMTCIPLDSGSGQLGNGQQSATIRSTTTGDATFLMAAALAVEQRRSPSWRIRYSEGRTLEPVERRIP